MSYKVVIPSAGIGARVGPYSKFMNKALVTIGDKPAISRVIEKFDINIPLVILIGYKGDMVREVLKQLYPKRKIEFVYVDKFKGKGSGLGYSLLKAKNFLQCPFIFIPNDTIIGADKVDLDPNLKGNWAAFYKKSKKDNYNPEIFRTLELNKLKTKVINITGKGTLNKNIYVGISGIKDYKKFWENMENEDAIQIGEAYGLNRLENIKAIEVFQWFDCGSLASLKVAKEHFLNTEHNILEKEDESIWFIDNQVIKFSTNKEFISDRVKRLEYLPKDFLPEIVDSNIYTYKYKKSKGKIISNILQPKNSKFYLIPAKRIYGIKKKVNKTEQKICYKFYKEKTYERLDKYLIRFEQVDRDLTINDKKSLSVKKLLDNLDWKTLCENPSWANFHGDFHGENIIYSKERGFILLDWRQNFGEKNYEFGDVYYDLAKLNHGFIVNHEVVAKGDFSVKEESQDKIYISIKQKSNLLKCQKFFYKWLKENNYNEKKINIITALIFVNISGLHEYPYSRFLFLLGQSMLNKYSD